jgi:hypothetical protein
LSWLILFSVERQRSLTSFVWPGSGSGSFPPPSPTAIALKFTFFPFGTVAAASFSAPALVMTVLYFTVIVLSLIRDKP